MQLASRKGRPTVVLNGDGVDVETLQSRPLQPDVCQGRERCNSRASGRPGSGPPDDTLRQQRSRAPFPTPAGCLRSGSTTATTRPGPGLGLPADLCPASP